VRTDVKTCLLICVWLINHRQQPPPTRIQVLQVLSLSLSDFLCHCGSEVSRVGAEDLGVERHLDKGH
jgi:hypothetical protein